MNKEIFNKLKNHKLALINKKNIKNGRMNIKLNKPSDIINNSPIPKIKSKSTNKLKTRIINGMNKFPAIKLPVKKNNIKNKFHNKNDMDKIQNTTMNNLKLKNYLKKEDTLKLRLKTNNSFNLKNFHSTQNSKKLLLNKTRDTSYNLKKSQNYIKTKDMNLMTNQNKGITRHFDRKKMKENKSIILPKQRFKLLKEKENKILNNNNLTKSREKFRLNNNNNFRKLNHLFEFDKKEKEIGNIFNRINLKTEINENIRHEKGNDLKIIDIISDISLSEEELNFSDEDSIDNMEFSFDDEEI